MINKTYKNFTILILMTFTFLSTYYLLMPALPIYIVNTIGGSKFQAAIIMGLFSISSLFMRPVSGRLLEGWGFKKVMYYCIILFLVTPFLYFLLPSLFTAGLNQIIYGLTLGAYTIAVVSLVSMLASPEKSARLIGWHSIAIISAKGFSPALGDFVFKSMGFLWVIMVSVVLCFLTLPFIYFYFLDNPEKGTIKNGRLPFLEILRRPSVYVPTICLLTGTFTFGTITVLLPLFALEREIQDISLFFIFNTIAVIITRLLIKDFAEKRIEKMAYFSTGMLIAALFLMALVFEQWQLILVGIIYGVGYGIFYPTISALLILNTPAEIRPTALGIFTSAFDLGVTLGTFAGGLSEYIGFSRMYCFSAVVPAIGIVFFAVFMKHKRGFLRRKSRLMTYENGSNCFEEQK